MQLRGSDALLVAAVSVGSTMVIFDGAAIQMALPVIQQELGTTLQGAQWAMNAFLLVSTCALLPVGRAGDLFGAERVWRVGVVTFVVASALCATVRGLPWLIVGRAAQGFAAALMAANSAPILVRAFPERSGQVLGLGNIGLAVGMVAGPPVGAILTRLASWRAIFLIAIPLGTGVLLAANSRLPRHERRPGSLGWLGGVLAMGGLAGVLIGTTSGHRWGWSSFATLGPIFAGIGLFVVFAIHERRSRSPMLKPSLFRERTFVAGIVGSLFGYAALFVGTTALPFFLLRAQGRTLVAAGLLVGTVPLAMSVVAPIAGKIADRHGSRGPCMVALFVLAVAFTLIALGGIASSAWWLGLALALAGAGVGGFEAPNDIGVLKALPVSDLSIATATLSAARNLGMTAGVAIAATVIDLALANRTGADAELVGRGVQQALAIGAGLSLLGVFASAFRRR